MRSPCDTCAFLPGSTTHDDEVYNRFRGQVAAISGVPFFCHHGHDYKKPIAVKNGIVFQVGSEPHRLQVCGGWQAQVAKDAKRDEPKWKRLLRKSLGQECLNLLDSAINTENAADKKELWAELGKQFRFLVRSVGWKFKKQKTAK